jgi:YidC/Oxa1 family membrane protein insertase
MLGEVWNTILVNPMLNVLVLFYKYTGNLGISIILLSALVRLLLFPLYTPSLKMAKKQKELKPELDKIKEKYKHDRKQASQAQMELYKKHGLNPASGCLTNIFVFLIPVALYGVINQMTRVSDVSLINSKIYFDFLKLPLGEALNLKFLYLNLAKPDRLFIIPVITAALQFMASKMMMPAVSAAEKLAKKTADKTDDLAYNVQQQMLYMLPVMMLIFGITLPSAVMLNILVSSVFSIVQNYFVSGLGGMDPYVRKLKKHYDNFRKN